MVTHLLKLKERARQRRLTHARIAAEAGVSRSLVSHVLAGRARSANVVDTLLRLLRGG